MASPESQKHAQAYWDHGFVSAIPVVSPEEAADHRGHLESAEREMGHDLHYHSKVHTVLKSPLELATHPALVDVVEAILGPDVMLYNVTYIIKEPKTVKFVSWHQDLTYWGFDGTEQASAWLALSPATAESGCMQMIPGSHRQGLREQITSDDPDNVLLQSQTIEDVREEDAVLCPLAPGQASIHHGWTIHASHPNSSEDRRIGLNIQYITPKMKQVKAKSDSAMLIRGEDRYGHFETDKPAEEWLPQDAKERLVETTSKYHAITGSPNPA